MIVRASKSIITPTCPKCGRLRREYARMNRRRLGIWGLHRMCCCDRVPTYRLDECECPYGDDPRVIFTDDDLSDHLFGIVKLDDGRCYVVSLNNEPGEPQPVVVVDDGFFDCNQCRTLCEMCGCLPIPEAFEVVFAGVTPCGCNSGCGGPPVSVPTNLNELNTVHILNPAGCIFSAVNIQYARTNCATQNQSSAFFNIRMGKCPNEDKIYLVAGTGGINSRDGSLFFGRADMGACDSVMNFVNEWTEPDCHCSYPDLFTCAGDSQEPTAFGGTATVTPL